jgi:hypothetical protein
MNQSSRRGVPLLDSPEDEMDGARRAKVKQAEKEVVLVMALVARKFQAWAALQMQPEHSVFYLQQEDAATGQKTGCVLSTEALTKSIHLSARLAVGVIELELDQELDRHQVLH